MATAKGKVEAKGGRAPAAKASGRVAKAGSEKGASAKVRAEHAVAKSTGRGELTTVTDFVLLPLDSIEFDKDQPRQDFHTLDGKVPPAVQQSLEELAANMAAEGLQAPITVREATAGSGRYIVVTGERRTRAALLNGWKEIVGRVRNDLAGARLKLYQLAENVQRSDLSESDTAQHVAKIVASGVPKKDIAREFNKEPAWVTRYLAFADARNRELYVKPGYFTKAWILYRFLQLPDHIQQRAIDALNDESRASREMTSEELKRLESYARSEKEQAAQAAATRSAEASATRTNTAPNSQPASSQRAAPSSTEKQAAVRSLLGDDDGDDGGYTPPRELVGGRSATAGHVSYADDNPDHDFSNTNRLASSLSELPAAATSVVASRLSIAQLVAVYNALEEAGHDAVAQMGPLATEFRIEASTLRAALGRLGMEVAEIPDTVLPLRLAEVGQKLGKKRGL